MRTTVQHTEAYELSVAIDATRHGHHLRLESLVPCARRPERHLRFEALLSRNELAALQAAIGQALAGTAQPT